MSSKTCQALRIAVVTWLALGLGACDSDSPTAPSLSNTPPPPASPSATWAITVNLNPSTVTLDAVLAGTNTAAIAVTARRSDGQSPPVDSTAVLSTTAGTLFNFEATAAGSSVVIRFGTAGVARATLAVPARVGNIVIRAQLEQSFGQAVLRVLEAVEVMPLFIEAVVPNSGPPAGGTVVRIEGSGFDPPVRVVFGSLFANVLSVRSSVVTVETPQISLPVGETSRVSVSVTINVNDPDQPQSTDILSNAFTYARSGQTEQPSIISISPTSGPNEGGTLVTVFGEGFANQVQVFFGTSALIEASVIEVGPTRLLVETPAATGPNSINQNAIVNVRVVNSASGLFAERSGIFQYGNPDDPIFISAGGPTAGPHLGGTIVTIFGQGFDEPVAIIFGTNAAGALVGQQVISVTGTEIVARSVPVSISDCASNSPGAFNVINIETGEGATAGLSFTYFPVEPVISSILPNEIGVDAGTGVPIPAGATTRISGFGFISGLRIQFGDVTTSIVPGSEVFDPGGVTFTAFDVTIPPFQGSFDTQECTDALGNTGTMLVRTPVDVTVLDLSTDCTDAFVGGFTYVPDDETCRVDIDPPTAAFSFTGLGASSTINFIDESTGSVVGWLWDFGDGSMSTLQNPPHDYVVGPPTIYTVTLTVTDTAGQSDSVSEFVEVPVPVAGDPPVAAFSSTGVGGSDTISFIDESTGAPTSWSWDFGDGGTSGLQNPTHDYGPGPPTIFTVSLTVTNAFGMDSTSDFVTVPVPTAPVAVFTVAEGANAFTVVNTEQSTGSPTTWTWDFGDGETSNLENPPPHDYTADGAGTYDITLTVTNAVGSSMATQSVTVPFP